MVCLTILDLLLNWNQFYSMQLGIYLFFLNFAGASETVVLNMSTLVWSVVTTVEGRIPVASEVI